MIISQRVVASTPLACTQLLTCCTPQTSCALWMYAHAESNTRYMHVRMYSHVLHAADKLLGALATLSPCESLVCQVELSWQGSEESEPPSTRAEGLRAAAEHFTTALAHGEAQGLHHIQSEALIHLARISYLQRQPAEALGLLRKHLDLVVNASTRMCGGCGQVRHEQYVGACRGEGAGGRESHVYACVCVDI